MDAYIVLFRIFLALLLGSIIGIEREIKSRPAGMRTHILVCLGACTIALIESNFLSEISFDSASSISFNFGRLGAQVISGIGFLGAGTILFSDRKITGLTTAASLWNAACLGLTIGYGYYLIAIIGSITVVLVLLIMRRIIRVHVSKKVEIRFVDRSETIEFLNHYFESHNIHTSDIDYNVNTSGEQKIYTITYTLHLPSKTSYIEIVNQLSEYDNILDIRTTNV